MSFLIDDILKQSCSKHCENVSPDTSSHKTELNSEVNMNKNPSILEYTLTNRAYFGSEVHQEIYNKFTANFDPMFNCYQESHVPKPPSTHYPFPRDSLWSTYMPYPVMFNCPHLHSRRKGGQIRFTSTQTEELEKQFNSHKYLSPEDRKQLADFLRLSDRQVKTWFQNRRAKWRRNSQVKTWFQNRRAKWRRNSQVSSTRNDLILIKNVQPNMINSRVNF